MVDKILKTLKTDRNTFATYIFFLLSMYVVIDRAVELLILVFTGVATSYWGPIQYTLAFAMPVFAFLFGCSSTYTKGGKQRITFFYMYTIMLYIIGATMAAQWLNQISWLLLLHVPNIEYIINELPNVIKPAITALTIYIPITTFYPVLKWTIFKISDTRLILESIEAYKGIDLSVVKEPTGIYTCENYFCTDVKKGHIVIVPEVKRFESTLVVGISGCGKTATIMEPMIARDIEKKFFFREVSKEMGYNALKNGYVTLTVPYDNDYINKNFSLDMLVPNEGKEEIYKAYMKKLIFYSDANTIMYRGLGITTMTPDYESTKHIIQFAQNYGVPINIIDPLSPDSVGLNPFAQKNPSEIAITIASAIKSMYFSEHPLEDEAFMQNITQQALENLAIILKEMYPRMNNGALPTLEDMLTMLNNFDLVEEMCEQLLEIPELARKYASTIGYFKKNFYNPIEGTDLGSGRSETSRYIFAATTQIDNLLRYPGIRNVLCNRTNNIDFDKILSEGQLTTVCTRRGEVGIDANKAFGLFFLLLFQHAVLKRPGHENNRLSHFIYVDEFADYISKRTEPMFTVFRKYRCATIIAVQNLAQLGKNHDRYRETILANSKTKAVFGDALYDDVEFWMEEFNDKREWTWKENIDFADNSTTTNKSDVEWKWKPNFEAGKIQAMGFRVIIYKTKDIKGKNAIGQGKTEFVEEKHKKKHEIKVLNFDKYILNSAKRRTNNSDTEDVDEPHNTDPIQDKSTDSKDFFENGDAISVKLKK